MLKCTNLGCLKQYNEEDNLDSSCVYHDGKPIFHELRKGWTCCNQIVYDWDEFQKLKGCKVGKHTDVKKEINFFKSQNPNDNGTNSTNTSNSNNDTNSNTNNTNTNTIVKPTVTPVVKDIAEYEKEQKRIQDEKNKAKNDDNQPMKNSEGKLFCGNFGCSLKVYSEEQNSDDACCYHVGKPIFHDLKKYWSCCKDKETWDWDEFMKIPTCAKGRHIPKYKNAIS